MAVKNTLMSRAIKPFLGFGNPVFHEILTQPGEMLLGIDVILKGTLNVSASVAPGVSHGPNPGGLVQQFELLAKVAPGSFYDGGRLVSLTPKSIIHRVVFDRGRDAEQVPIDGTVALKNVYQRFTIPFAFPNLVRPIESALRTDQYSSLILKITNAGSLASMLVGFNGVNDGGVNLVYEIIEHRAYNPTFFPIVTPYQDDVQIQIQQASKRFSVRDQISQAEAYIDALVLTESNSDLVDTILNKVNLLANGEKFWDQLDQADLRRLNGDYSKETGNVLTGKYLLPVAEGMLRSAVGNLAMELDVNNPGIDDLLISSRRCTFARTPKPKRKAV